MFGQLAHDLAEIAAVLLNRGAIFSEFPFARPSRADILNCAVAVQPLDD
jgi:hypothetical protein